MSTDSDAACFKMTSAFDANRPTILDRMYTTAYASHFFIINLDR